MDAQHRKCNREHEDIPEAPQARCSAAGPLPAQPGGKLSTDRTFCRRGMRLVRLGNCATLHPSVLGAHAVRAVLQFDFVFFHSFFIGFPSAIANCANVRISPFLLDSRAKTVLNAKSFFLKSSFRDFFLLVRLKKRGGCDGRVESKQQRDK
jgi:hypothetical protein